MMDGHRDTTQGAEGMKIRAFDLLAPFYDIFMMLFRRQIPGMITISLKPEQEDVALDIGGGTGYNAARIKGADPPDRRSGHLIQDVGAGQEIPAIRPGPGRKFRRPWCGKEDPGPLR